MQDWIKREIKSLRKRMVSECPTCAGQGFVFDEIGIESPCRCMLVVEFILELMLSGIPRTYWAMTFSDLEKVDSTYLEFAEYFLSRLQKAVDNGLGLVFCGPNGVGKTSLQCIIGREAMASGYSVRYFTLEQYLNASRKGDDEFMQDCENADVLLVDELDKAYVKRGSDHTPKKTEDLLRRALSDGKVVVICTNFEQERIAGVFGESLYSMLQRKLKFVEIDGDDVSPSLQDSWYSLMDEKFDYYAEAIVDCSIRYHDSVMHSEAE